MSDRNEPPRFEEIASVIFGVPEADLPADELTLREGLIAEAVRLSLAASAADDQGWRRRHILSLRSWVGRKLRAVIPEIDSPSAEKDIFIETLRDGVGGNLLFLGDIIELANGYYAPSPTRVVPITEDNSLLVSGLPTVLFVQAGLHIGVTGISRAIRESATSLESRLGIPIQDRESYIGLMESEGFREKILDTLLQRVERRSWAQAGDWICYQGNQGTYGFDHWRPRHHAVSSRFGFLSLWKAAEEFGITEYWLRIRDAGEDEMVRIPRTLLRQLCLLLDDLDGAPRDVVFSESDLGAVIKTRFPPPAAQTRWLHAVGGQWMGGKHGWIRWRVPVETVESTADVFGKLPVRIERGIGK